MSGPLLDRIDIQIEVPAVTAADLALPSPSEGSSDVAERVARARARQHERLVALGVAGVRTNADCSGRVLEQIAALDGDAQALITSAATTLGLSARGYHRTVKVARTLADLDDVDAIGRAHIAEALPYRGETLRQQVAA